MKVTEVLDLRTVPFRNRDEALVYLTHAHLVEAGFRCVGIGSSSTTVTEPARSGDLPFGWDANPDVYVLRYRHSQSSLTFTVKFVPMSETFLAIHARASEGPDIVTFSVDVSEYVDASHLSEPPQVLKREREFRNVIEANLVQKLVPVGTARDAEAQTGTSEDSSQGGSSSRVPPRHPEAYFDPLREDPSQYLPRPTINPFGIGSEDLLPAGLPARPFPTAGPGFPSPGGGSIVGPHHPMFNGNRRPPHFPQGPGGYPLPPGAVPPGARFDPFGPPPPPDAGVRPRPDIARGRGSGDFPPPPDSFYS